MQHEVTVIQDLLDSNGHLREPGWAKKPVFNYRRKDIKASRFRIKEWDYYLILNDHHAIALTLADNSYMGMISASVLDFDSKTEHTDSIMTAFPMGKFKMPETADESHCHFENKRAKVDFLAANGTRNIFFEYKNFWDGKDLHAEFILTQPFEDRIVIATPWKEDPKAFYYNQKINCMPAKGFYTLGDNRVDFQDSDTFGTLDWGRGVWTRDNTWYWGSGNGWVEGGRFGFNFGYGFGDTSAATENALLYEGLLTKVDEVKFLPSDPEHLLMPWRIESNDDRVDLDFSPILDRAAAINALILSTDQHQVFGRVSGNVLLKNNRRLVIRDLTCFFEIVHNVY